MAVTMGRAGVPVTGQVRHFDQVVELVRDQRHERVPQFVGRPVLTQAGSAAERTEVLAQVPQQERVPLRVQNTKLSGS